MQSSILRSFFPFNTYFLHYGPFSEDKMHLSRDFHILFVPRRSMLCEQRLKELGVLGSFINIDEYILDLIPYDGDLLSMEYESAFRVCSTYTSQICINDSAALWSKCLRLCSDCQAKSLLSYPDYAQSDFRKFGQQKKPKQNHLKLDFCNWVEATFEGSLIC